MFPKKLPFRCIDAACIVFTLIVTLVSISAAQQAASVAYTCDFPGSDPSHYAFSIASDGSGSYISDGKLSPSSDHGETSSLRFTISSNLTNRIFDLSRQAHYFEGQIDSKKKNVAFTGDKSLSYKDGQRANAATYNYSTIPAVQELTTIFQSLSVTLEFGRRLDNDYHYQKLALDEELKRMEDMNSRGSLSEVGVIAPILQKILDDPSVINEVRGRAQKLLAGGAPGTK